MTKRARVHGSAITLAVVGHEVVGVVGHINIGLCVVGLLLARHETLLASLAPPAAEAGQQEQRHGGNLDLTIDKKTGLVFIRVNGMNFKRGKFLLLSGRWMERKGEGDAPGRR